MLIQEKSRLIGRDVSIKIPLSTNSDLNGLQQNIDTFKTRETGLSINDVIDGEKYRYISTKDVSIAVNFISGTSSTSSFLNAGFTESEMSNNTSNVRNNSFFIFQLYDSTSTTNQTLLNNTYYNLYNVNGVSSVLPFRRNNEYSNIYIPESFINDNRNNTSISAYLKVLFFNAKIGKLQVFSNAFKNSITTEDRLYYDVTLLPNTKKYDLPSIILFDPPLYLMSFNEIKDAEYVNKINSTLNSFRLELPVYPSENTFNEKGRYENNF